MSYYYTFSQYPTKDLRDLWDAFVDGTLASRVDEEVALLAVEEARLHAIPRSYKTLYEDKEAFIQDERNHAAWVLVRDRKYHWKEFQEKLAEAESSLSATRDKKKIAQIGRAFMETLRESLCTLFIRDAGGYSESCRDQDYAFLCQLYETIHGKHPDSLRSIPTTDQWVAVFRALKPEFATDQLRAFMESESVPEEKRLETEQRCLKLVVLVRNLLKQCLDRGWDLVFTSEYWGGDETVGKYEKSLVAGSVEKLVEKRTIKPL